MYSFNIQLIRRKIYIYILNFQGNFHTEVIFKTSSKNLIRLSQHNAVSETPFLLWVKLVLANTQVSKAYNVEIE